MFAAKKTHRLVRIHSFCPLVSSVRNLFGLAFDIDGVLLRGGQPIDGASDALHKLYTRSTSTLRVPFILLTNGGGVPEFVRASELSNLLDVKILPEQVFLGHAPFKGLVDHYGNANILVTGKGDPDIVMAEYGYRNVFRVDEYASHFQDIDALSKYKQWSRDKEGHPRSRGIKFKPIPKHIDAVFIVSDPVDWGRDIQILLDVLCSGGSPGMISGSQPPLFFAADDFQYQAAFPVERLGMGAFRIALESIFNRVGERPLSYTSFGKPKVCVFQEAEKQLQKLSEKMSHEGLETIYMIGDNPATDIKGAREAGKPWYSILTRTGCFKGIGNHAFHPADMVFDDVLDAVNYILRKHDACA